MGISELLFPAECLLCRGVCEPGVTLCRRCAKSLRLLPNPRPDDRRTSARNILWTVTPFRYEGGVRRGIQYLKFHGDTREADFFGGAIARVISEAGLSGDFDCVTFVPMTESKLRERGYNQSQLLAEEVARRLGKPVLAGVLRRSGLLVQHQLDAGFRARSAPHSYRLCEGAEIPSLRVLLVDDVITTGETARFCASLLLRAGASSVCLAAAAS